ncbi:MAG: LysR family transcriptional regulator [Hungatella sp.]|jgi:DNA-binding transcriptional LysR family regulator|nr:LysR family transcriptional regulator [Hungatella sp.]
MNTNHLRYMLAIAGSKNLTAAAQGLYLTQPALTKTLNMLEETYQVQLFDRSTSPIMPTYAGTVFLEAARQLLDMEEHLESQMRLLSNGEKGRISFGIPGAHGTTYLPLIVPAFTKKYPNMTIDITEAHMAELEQRLLTGNLDICMSTLPISLDILDYEEIFDDPIVIGVSKDSDFAKQFNLSCNTLFTPYVISGKDLNGQIFNSGSPEGGVRRAANDLFMRHSVHPKHIHTFCRHETAVKLAAVDGHFVVTPCFTPKSLGVVDKMAFFTLDNPVYCRKKIICYRKGMLLSPQARQLIQIIKDVVRQEELFSTWNINPLAPQYKEPQQVK